MSERVRDNDETTPDTESQVEESGHTDSGQEEDASVPETPEKEFVFPELYKD